MVQLERDMVKQIVVLLVLFSQKAAFDIQEFKPIGGLFERFKKASEAEKQTDFSIEDINTVISTINVCCQRKPVEVQNYRGIADMLDMLTKIVEDDKKEPKDTGAKTEL